MPSADLQAHDSESPRTLRPAGLPAATWERDFSAAIKVADETALELHSGVVLPRLEISYESWGTLAPTRDNVILVCPAFSAHSHANSHPDDPTPGWWEGMIGPGCAFDTDRFFVVCPSLLGGACGTTGPRSVDPHTGRPYGSAFPLISVRDIVAVHLRLLDHLGIECLFAACGGSLGAMEAMELAIRHPARVARVVAISGTDYTRPYTAAIRHLGRRAIQLGRAGDSRPRRAAEGLRLAREIGTLFYRSRREINQRFSNQHIRPPSLDGVTFEVQGYLEHQGDKAVKTFDVDSYLTLSMAMDLHDVWKGHRSRREALESVRAEFLVAGAEEDCLIPIDEQRDFHHRLVAAGIRSSWRSLRSAIGHDAFLVEADIVGRWVSDFLAGGCESSSLRWCAG